MPQKAAVMKKRREFPITSEDNRQLSRFEFLAGHPKTNTTLIKNG